MMKPANETPIVEATLARIAARHLGLDTLDIQNNDSIDFQEHAVWCIRAALAEAYAAGRNSVR